MSRRGLVAVIVAIFAVAGCGETPVELGVGARDSSGAFAPLASGDDLQLVVSTGGLPAVVPALRTRGVDPREVSVTAELSQDGVVIGSFLERREPVDDGDGYQVWEAVVRLRVASCCAVCRDAELRVSLGEGSDEMAEAVASPRLTFAVPCSGTEQCCAPDSCQGPVTCP